MKPITFIGDVHGHFDKLNIVDHLTIQVGDLNVGFWFSDTPTWPDNFRYIAGNHDNRIECANHPNYLGHYGYLEDYDLFFVSGAKSTDFKIGNTHFYHEELTTREFDEALDLYAQVKPSIVVSHDCPQIAYNTLFRRSDPTHTRSGLQSLLECHKPKLWVFGHHHQTKDEVIEGTRFVCLAINEHKTFEGI